MQRKWIGVGLLTALVLCTAMAGLGVFWYKRVRPQPPMQVNPYILNILSAAQNCGAALQRLQGGDLSAIPQLWAILETPGVPPEVAVRAADGLWRSGELTEGEQMHLADIVQRLDFFEARLIELSGPYGSQAAYQLAQIELEKLVQGAPPQIKLRAALFWNSRGQHTFTQRHLPLKDGYARQDLLLSILEAYFVSGRQEDARAAMATLKDDSAPLEPTTRFGLQAMAYHRTGFDGGRTYALRQALHQSALNPKKRAALTRLFARFAPELIPVWEARQVPAAGNALRQPVPNKPGAPAPVKAL